MLVPFDRAFSAQYVTLDSDVVRIMERETSLAPDIDLHEPPGKAHAPFKSHVI